ncbi:alanine racemase [Polymorphobacter arshaanensis]|uniref:Alanine racemase n=1 Tax=Glacieibacterium arshaanense TaxID=2511025 RepID=A0A4Y9EM97_9SPHN|nr:alanine racemase [Polymorphobacter arshaanensis]TFU01305.1 alanine racemase [Polymorphobacter arshaanensis]
MLPSPASPRLLIDRDALVANWRLLAAMSGAAACGAAIKADGYGIGAAETLATLAAAGCRDFFVAQWSEVAALGPLPAGVSVAVLHGIQHGEMATARASAARPVLCTPAQVAAWAAAGGGTCDIMVDTGMNRLGLTPAQAASGLLDGIAVDTLHSHLACADEPAHPLNARQCADFTALVTQLRPCRAALANSAGIALGADYHFGLTRPGLGLYGGQPVTGSTLALQQVVRIEAGVVQVRDVEAGASIGYGATFVAPRAMRIAVLGLGYADGYRRALGASGVARIGGRPCPVVGRISMDLLMVDATGTSVAEGDRVDVDFDLAAAAAASDIAQYELLTGLGQRYSRCWT